MSKNNRYCLLIDLKNDPELIKEYDDYHRNVWPEILNHHKGSGITSMDIYRAGNRLFMIMETRPDFSFEQKNRRDNASEIVQRWENLMARLQQPLPFSRPGEKWILMEKVFSLA